MSRRLAVATMWIAIAPPEHSASPFHPPVHGRDRGAQLVHFIDGAADAPMPQYRLDGSVLASRAFSSRPVPVEEHK